MARRTLDRIMASPPDVDRERLAATTEADIRRHAREDGHDPDGEIDEYREVLPPRTVRERLGLTQVAFAAALRVPVGTVRNWEQARTLPDPAARSLLDAVAAAPDAVLGALREKDDRPARRTTRSTVAAPPSSSPGDGAGRARVWLAQRRDSRGRPLLDASLLAASMRLHGDIIEAALIPTGSADRVVTDPDTVEAHAPAFIPERMIAARQRLRASFDVVGEDLSGLLIDLCGYLKDLDRIEMERRWPPRSAEVIIGIALRRLTEHYGLQSEPIGTVRATDLHRHTRADEADHDARQA